MSTLFDEAGLRVQPGVEGADPVAPRSGGPSGVHSPVLANGDAVQMSEADIASVARNFQAALRKFLDALSKHGLTFGQFLKAVGPADSTVGVPEDPLMRAQELPVRARELLARDVLQASPSDIGATSVASKHAAVQPSHAHNQLFAGGSGVRMGMAELDSFFRRVGETIGGGRHARR